MTSRNLCLLASLFVIGCAQTLVQEDPDVELLQIMNSWKGYHISQLIEMWGPYASSMSDGAGGTLYIWQTDPLALPPITPPTTSPTPHTSGSGFLGGLQSGTQQALQRRIQSTYEERVRLRQRYLAQKRVFYTRRDGIIYAVKIAY